MSSLVLLSGGLDSTINAYIEKEVGNLTGSLTIDYGQRAFKRELTSAKITAAKLGIWNEVIDLSWLKGFSGSSLTKEDETVPVDVDLTNQEATANSAKSVWVPNRNGIMINVAAGLAEARDISQVIVGFNREEAQTFPDNSNDYLKCLNDSFQYSTANRVKVVCHTVNDEKNEIVRKGKELDVDFSTIWSCYFGGEEPCGKCESCSRFNNALKINGVF